MFHVAQGDTSTNKKVFIGTISSLPYPLEVYSQSLNIKIKKINEYASHVFFLKPNFQVVSHKIYNDEFLFITLQSEYKCSDGDKVSSLLGQKSVIRHHPNGPAAIDYDGKILRIPKMLINPEAILKRQTMGQILEILRDGGKDYNRIINSSGKLVSGKALIGPVFYFPVNYRSIDHLYIGKKCVKDKITGQPVKGRSRKGGMKAGVQEVFNCYRGLGIAACYNEKLIQNSDSLMDEDRGLCIPKSAYIIEEDLKFFKVTMKLNTECSFILETIARNKNTFDCLRRKLKKYSHKKKRKTFKF